MSDEPQRWFPKLDKQERTELHVSTSAGAEWDADFVVMMLLASTLASLGLLQGSAAVVIGAMLVAPLMGPLVATGLALVQGNLLLFKRGVSVSLAGVGLGLVVSLVFGILNPGYEPSMEIEARGEPDPMDLLIAFASGMAGAYAMARPKVAATVAGVAIAAALVPPLAVVGIAITNERPGIAGYATVLLVTNLVAIVLGSAASFRLLGCNVAAAADGAPPWAKRAVMTLGLGALLLCMPLVLRRIDVRNKGLTRPLLYPVSAPVRDAVDEWVAERDGVIVVTMGSLSVEPQRGIRVLLSSDHPVAPTIQEDLRSVIIEARGEEVPVQIFAFLSAVEGQ